MEHVKSSVPIKCNVESETDVNISETFDSKEKVQGSVHLNSHA